MPSREKRKDVVDTQRKKPGEIIRLRKRPKLELSTAKLTQYLDPSAWSRGLGRQLMDSSVEELRRLGYREAVLWVLDSNQRARRFYEIAGWSADGGAKEDDSRGFVLREVRYGRSL